MWTCHNYHSYRISNHLVNLSIWYRPTGIINMKFWVGIWLVPSTRLPRSEIISLYSCFLYIYLMLLLQDINDMPPDPNRPIPKPRMAPRPKVRTKQPSLINYVFISLVQTKDCMIQYFGNVQLYIWDSGLIHTSRKFEIDIQETFLKLHIFKRQSSSHWFYLSFQNYQEFQVPC